MSKVNLDSIQKLRTITGLGMMDCKKALEETNGDIDAAIEALRKRGAAIAAKRSDRDTAQGLVHAYIHPGSQIGVLVELNCETDFVARNDAMKQFAQDLGLHITAMKPQYLAPEDVDPAFLAKEHEIMTEQLKNEGKPEAAIAKILEGKTTKLYTDICLLKQAFVKNDKLSVEEVIKELIAKTGENIRIRRFARFEIGA
ncbi:translation elongation factor Ts [bacterium]|jgi:elongation factor Ts|nr:translation elongation factor Ts [bacterium]NBX78177.1 translation elongation factor Ts [bacterium]